MLFKSACVALDDLATATLLVGNGSRSAIAPPYEVH
jgi:hypothetical protein